MRAWIEENNRSGKLFLVSLVSIFAFLFAFQAVAQNRAKASPQEKKLAEALIQYKQGKYNETMNMLNQVRGNRNLLATVRYWKGLVRAKQQKFDLAIINFEKADQLGSKAEDLHYQLGQAYYAAQKLPKAIAAFKKSASVRYYKIAASAYYIGYIHQLRDEPKKALSYYERIARLKDDPDKVKQPALYQTAEIHFDNAKKIKDSKERIDTYIKKIRPLFERAYDFDNESIAGKEAKARMDLIDKERAKLARQNKKKSPWRFKAEADLRYDSNVITKADDAVVSVANQSSMIFKTTARANFKKRISEKWRFNAGSKASIKYHTERGTPDIFKNDSGVLGLDFSFDRKNDFLTKNAMHSIGFDLTYTLQDHRKIKNLAFFSRSYTLYGEETLNIWETGPSKFKLSWKYYDHHLISSSNVQFLFSANQKLKLTEKLKLSSTFQFTWLYGKQSSSDTIRYEWNNRLPIPFSESEYTLIPYLGFSVLDTRENQPTRGWEKKFNLNLTLRRNIRKESKYILKAGWDFTRNFSQDTANQQYYQHQIFFNGAYRF